MVRVKVVSGHLIQTAGHTQSEPKDQRTLSFWLSEPWVWVFRSCCRSYSVKNNNMSLRLRRVWVCPKPPYRWQTHTQSSCFERELWYTKWPPGKVVWVSLYGVFYTVLQTACRSRVNQGTPSVASFTAMKSVCLLLFSCRPSLPTPPLSSTYFGGLNYPKAE